MVPRTGKRLEAEQCCSGEPTRSKDGELTPIRADVEYGEKVAAQRYRLMLNRGRHAMAERPPVRGLAQDCNELAGEGGIPVYPGTQRSPHRAPAASQGDQQPKATRERLGMDTLYSFSCPAGTHGEPRLGWLRG